MYLSQAKKLVLSNPNDNIEIVLDPFNFELVTASLVTILAGKSLQFALIGLVNMLNSGGAIRSLAYNDSNGLIRIRVKGVGEMRVFASEKPRDRRIDEREVVGFQYEECRVVVQAIANGKGPQLWAYGIVSSY
ncbi:hypothetical protein GH714_041702 [Hevea brasiliensis]|uniref:Uncharacterized protein n=1 Tax=Hevea brasiliensis TaxID=3981 RepID=A0A6A6MRE2_HEVBR|nr:hypothetical protein GH714_041702 [Hevea brasiliensis]